MDRSLVKIAGLLTWPFRLSVNARKLLSIPFNLSLKGVDLFANTIIKHPVGSFYRGVPLLSSASRLIDRYGYNINNVNNIYPYAYTW